MWRGGFRLCKLQQNRQTGTGPVNRTLRIALGQRIELVSTGSDLRHRKIGLAAAAINYSSPSK